MIQVLPLKIWEKIGDVDTSNPEVIFIDLRDCRQTSQIVLRFAQELRGKTSASLQSGNSLDAFSDVLWDWFFEHWGKKKHVHIVGWANATKLAPVFVQEILNVLSATYLSVVWGQAKALYDGEDSVVNLAIHSEISGNKRFFFYLN